MLKFFILALCALHCYAQQVIEVSGHNGVKSIPNIYSALGGYRGVHPFHSYAHNPLSAYYGNIGGIRSIGGLGLNIAPSPYSYIPYQQHHLAAVHQPAHHVAVHRPAYQTVHGIHVQQPAYQTVHGVHVQQPAVHAVHVQQPAVQAIHAIQPSVAIRPQVYAHSQAVHPVNAAIHQVGRTVSYNPVPYNDQPIVPQTVEVAPSDQPIHIHFKSRSSTVRLSQEHIPGEPGSIEQTSSQDEPHKVIHEVVKPVIQEVREVITPYRQLTQEVQPVVENVHTSVAHAEGERQQYVVEPQVVRPHFQTVPAVHQVAVPSVHQVAVPSVHQVAVPSVHQVAVPSVHQVAVPAVQQIHYQRVEQPVHYQTVAQVVPQVHAVGQHVQQVVPHYQSVVQHPFAYQHYSRPAVGVVHRTVVAPQVQHINRVISVQQPTVGVTHHEVKDQVFRDARVHNNQKVDDFRTYAESSK